MDPYGHQTYRNSLGHIGVHKHIERQTIFTKDGYRYFVAGFGLSSIDAGVFSRSQLAFPWILWIIYRVIIIISYTTYSVFLFCYDGHVYILQYLSNWTSFLVAIYYMVATVNLLKDREYGRRYHFVKSKQELPHLDLSWRHKTQWILMNIFINTSLLVTICYWSILNGYPSFATEPIRISYDILEHIFPTILGVIEILMTPIPIKFQHFIHSEMYLCVYLVVTVIFYYGDPTLGAIYPALDYSDAGLILETILAALALAIVIQVLMWILCKCKVSVLRHFIDNGPNESQKLIAASPVVVFIVDFSLPSKETHVNEVFIQDEMIGNDVEDLNENQPKNTTNNDIKRIKSINAKIK